MRRTPKTKAATGGVAGPGLYRTLPDVFPRRIVICARRLPHLRADVDIFIPQPQHVRDLYTGTANVWSGSTISRTLTGQLCNA